MAFHSFPFLLLFLPVSVAGFFLAARIGPKAAKGWLIACSLVFYTWTGWKGAPILACSILFNHAVSSFLGPEREHSGVWLRIGLYGNLLALCMFKYIGFAVANVNAVAGTNWRIFSFILPLGVSFFTVQQIMFLVDRHQGLTPRQSFLDYALFVSWFPYIVAGPITKWKDVIPQLDAGMRVNSENLSRGIALFVLGLSKKVLISDSFARWVDSGFTEPSGLGWAGSWIVAASYALQIYFDFSGYTDMARGVGLMMNVRLPENFANPFRATSLIAYWQRWHMSLTNFVTHYVYTPILRSGGRPTFWKAMGATMIAMITIGVWHGASWCYAAFGVFHGLGLVVNHMWRRLKRPISPVLSWFLMAAFLLVAFVLFRSATMGGALLMLRAMFAPGPLIGGTFREMLSAGNPQQAIGMLAAVAMLLVTPTASDLAATTPLRPRYAVALAVFAYIAMIVMNSKATVGFIYRQF